MNVKELRIGNLVYCLGVKEVVAIQHNNVDGRYRLRVSEIGCKEYHYCPVEALELEPIPLKEDWLIKLGFECLTNSVEERFRKGDFNWYSSLGSVVIELDNGISSYDLHTDCKYVHQLQNLYFALLGEELEIND